jgi:hypothetical protein
MNLCEAKTRGWLTAFVLSSPPQSSSEFRPIPAIKWSLDLSQTLHTAGTTPSVRGRGGGGGECFCFYPVKTGRVDTDFSQTITI